jgi:hypothetical protein
MKVNFFIVSFLLSFFFFSCSKKESPQTQEIPILKEQVSLDALSNDEKALLASLIDGKSVHQKKSLQLSAQVGDLLISGADRDLIFHATTGILAKSASLSESLSREIYNVLNTINSRRVAGGKADLVTALQKLVNDPSISSQKLVILINIVNGIDSSTNTQLKEALAKLLKEADVADQDNIKSFMEKTKTVVGTKLTQLKDLAIEVSNSWGNLKSVVLTSVNFSGQELVKKATAFNSAPAGQKIASFNSGIVITPAPTPLPPSYSLTNNSIERVGYNTFRCKTTPVLPNNISKATLYVQLIDSQGSEINYYIFNGFELNNSNITRSYLDTDTAFTWYPGDEFVTTITTNIPFDGTMVTCKFKLSTYTEGSGSAIESRINLDWNSIVAETQAQVSESPLTILNIEASPEGSGNMIFCDISINKPILFNGWKLLTAASVDGLNPASSFEETLILQNNNAYMDSFNILHVGIFIGTPVAPYGIFESPGNKYCLAKIINNNDVIQGTVISSNVTNY